MEVTPAIGTNCTPMLQLAPGASDAGHAFDASKKAFGFGVDVPPAVEAETLEMVSGPMPVFVSVDVATVAVATLPNAMPARLSDGATPCPLTDIAPLANCAPTLRLPEAVPAAVGANCTANEHCAPAASDEPQLLDTMLNGPGTLIDNELAG